MAGSTLWQQRCGRRGSAGIYALYRHGARMGVCAHWQAAIGPNRPVRASAGQEHSASLWSDSGFRLGKASRARPGHIWSLEAASAAAEAPECSITSSRSKQQQRGPLLAIWWPVRWRLVDSNNHRLLVQELHVLHLLNCTSFSAARPSHLPIPQKSPIPPTLIPPSPPHQICHAQFILLASSSFPHPPLSISHPPAIPPLLALRPSSHSPSVAGVHFRPIAPCCCSSIDISRHLDISTPSASSSHPTVPSVAGPVHFIRDHDDRGGLSWQSRAPLRVRLCLVGRDACPPDPTSLECRHDQPPEPWFVTTRRPRR